MAMYAALMGSLVVAAFLGFLIWRRQDLSAGAFLAFSLFAAFPILVVAFPQLAPMLRGYCVEVPEGRYCLDQSEVKGVVDGTLSNDDKLVRAQAAIQDLERQNGILEEALKKIEARSPESANQAAALGKLNTDVLAASNEVKSALAAAIARNGPLVQRLQAAGVTEAARWAVVFGADRTLAEARYETGPVATKLGFAGAVVYLRQNVYRSVVPASDRLAADQLLARAKARRQDAYIVDLNAWCPSPVPREEFVECPASG